MRVDLKADLLFVLSLIFCDNRFPNVLVHVRNIFSNYKKELTIEICWMILLVKLFCNVTSRRNALKATKALKSPSQKKAMARQF